MIKFTLAPVDKRSLSKKMAKMLVGGVASKTVSKMVLAKFPEKEFTSKLAGTFAGVVVADKMEPITDQLVDIIFQKIDDHKAAKTVNTTTP